MIVYEYAFDFIVCVASKTLELKYGHSDNAEMRSDPREYERITLEASLPRNWTRSLTHNHATYGTNCAAWLNLVRVGKGLSWTKDEKVLLQELGALTSRVHQMLPTKVVYGGDGLGQQLYATAGCHIWFVSLTVRNLKQHLWMQILWCESEWGELRNCCGLFST